MKNYHKSLDGYKESSPKIIRIKSNGEEVEIKHSRSIDEIFDGIASLLGSTTISWTGGEVCLHKNCVGCKNGTCSGVHMLSCPCRSCNPFYTG